MVITNWFGVFFTFGLPLLLLGLAAVGEKEEVRKRYETHRTRISAQNAGNSR